MNLANTVKDREGRPFVIVFTTRPNPYGYVYQFMPTCPFCGGTHLHSVNDDGRVFAPRVQHCDTGTALEYHLINLGKAPDLIQRLYMARFWGGKKQ